MKYMFLSLCALLGSAQIFSGEAQAPAPKRIRLVSIFYPIEVPNQVLEQVEAARLQAQEANKLKELKQRTANALLVTKQSRQRLEEMLSPNLNNSSYVKICTQLRKNIEITGALETALQMKEPYDVVRNYLQLAFSNVLGQKHAGEKIDPLIPVAMKWYPLEQQFIPKLS